MEKRTLVTLLREELATYLAHKAVEDVRAVEAGNEASLPPAAILSYLQHETELAALSPRDLLDFATYCKIDFHRTIALILKGEWQWYVTRRHPEGKSVEDAAEDGLAALRELSGGFKPAMKKDQTCDVLYRLLESRFGSSGANGYDENELRNIVNHMVLADIHLFAGNSLELENFIAAEQTERRFLKEASTEEAEAFWKKKRIWIELENEVGELLLNLEEQILKNRKSKRDWMATFGPIYIPLVEEEYRFNSLTYRIKHKSKNPSLTVQDLDDMEEENRKAEKEHLARLKKSAVALRIDLSGPGGIPPEDDEVEEYDKESKRILRKIWRLTHPDAIARERFTSEQKKKLRAYFEEAVPYQESRRLEDNEITLAMRSLFILKDLLGKVEAIWKSMGMECNENSVIQGESLTEQCTWIDQRIESLEEETNQVRVELMVAVEDPEFREMDACISSAEQIVSITEALEAKLDWYKERNRELEQRLTELFGE